MKSKQVWKKGWLIALVLCVQISTMPFGSLNVAQAEDGSNAIVTGSDQEVRINGIRVGNISHSAENMMVNFSRVSGFNLNNPSNITIDPGKGDVYIAQGQQANYILRVADNPTLANLAASGHATLEIGWNKLEWTSVCKPLCFGKNYQGTRATILVNNSQVDQIEAYHGATGKYSRKITLQPNQVIDLRIQGIRDWNNKWTGIRGLYFKIEDKTRPTLDGVVFTGDGFERTNDARQQEMYIKKDENINLTYRFSEPVLPSVLTSSFNDHFLRHPLFTNDPGTGLPGAGDVQYLNNISFTPATIKQVSKEITYRYTGAAYHNSGNLPVDPFITGKTDNADPMTWSLHQKLEKAELVDAAGNAARIDFSVKAGVGSHSHVLNNTNNPFDSELRPDGTPGPGMSIIVDTVAPKYSKTGNGIQPEIITNAILNKNDRVEFTVNFTDEVMVTNRPIWDVRQTYLLFNNGMKAYYVSGEGTKVWKFSMQVEGLKSEEAPLLKVIALTHDKKVEDHGLQNADKAVVEDYAGNVLMQPANFKGPHTGDDGDASTLDSTIDWAGLVVDNTANEVIFEYEAGGATDVLYGKQGKVTINASDPDILVPGSNPAAFEPSKGVFRPSNVTGGDSSATGLVYYYWSRNADNPLASMNKDNYAAIKRFSLTGKQPSEQLYPGELTDFQLSIANNKTNLISVPDEALQAEGSGTWYLHTWTADMTWDSARELKQYTKRDQFINGNAGQYEAWKDEEEGTESQKEFYANTKAMAAVGQYGDLSVWSLADFKEDDSNWVYSVGPIKLDNEEPTIFFESLKGNGTANVKIDVLLSDAHSGVKEGFYKFVSDPDNANLEQWQSMSIINGRQTLSAADLVPEDGEYTLYIKAVDHADNESITSLVQTVIVDSSFNAQGSFSPEVSTNYVRAHDLQFNLSGMNPKNNSIRYTWSTSSVSPPDLHNYTTVTAATYSLINHPTVTDATYGDPTVTGATYGHSFTILKDETKHGFYYIHVNVQDESQPREYTLTQGYYWDNVAPTVTFSRDSSSFVRTTQEVTVTVSETLSPTGLIKKYQWVRDGAPVPDETASGWLEWPSDSTMILTNADLLPGESAAYRLYVWAQDGVGNSGVVASGLFEVTKPEVSTAPIGGNSDLLYVFSGEEDQHLAILELTLSAEDKTGYQYSVSSNGTTWSTWKPYTNFISAPTTTDVPEEMKFQVKFRNGSNQIGEPVEMNPATVDTTEPIFALASIASLRKVRSSVGVEIDIDMQPGIKVTPADVNPMVPVRLGSSSTFKVTKNGFYTFDLVDLTDSTRIDQLFIVVSLIDDVAPTGEIEQIAGGDKSRSVLLKLTTNEPVRITNNDGRNTRVVHENGTYAFEFEDEAGNRGSKEVEVTTIDRTPPEVRITKTYRFGNGADEFGRIMDGQDVIAAAGVVLTVEKAREGAEEFTVVKGSRSVTLKENGKVTFVVSDAAGNTTTISETIEFIESSKALEPEQITYTFVDAAGAPLDSEQIVEIDGKPYARGQVKMTATGTTSVYNPVFSGTKAIKDSIDAYTNKISDGSGAYTLERTFDTNGQMTFALSDVLGNKGKFTAKVEGLDNTPPVIKLTRPVVTIEQNKADFNFKTDLGGYTVSDNISKPADVSVTIAGLDLAVLGKQRVTYTAADQVGNTTTVVQDVIVAQDSGMQLFANDILISATSSETALLNTNRLQIDVRNFNTMVVDGTSQLNEVGTYDLIYYSGIYREGQMKYIAQSVSYEELTAQDFTVVLPTQGWYTVIVRNQERERVYATFFVSKVN